MRYFLILLVAFGLSSCSKSDSPNILLIVVDDLGYADLACYGNELVETPNIDRLAADGIRFTTAYASCTVCSPTRASLMTGKNPVAVDITDWIPGYQVYNGGPRPDEMLVTPSFNLQLQLEEISIAEMLKEAGYITASIGKWHLGGEGYHPTDQGFDLNVAGYEKGSPPSYYYPYRSVYRKDSINPLSLTGDSLYLTDRLTNEAIQFMDSNSEKPFFLYLPFYNVHTPLEGRPDLLEKYEIRLTDHQNDSILRNPHFLAMTEAVDKNVGRMMQFLKDKGLEKNTVVILTSDNGGLQRRNGNFIRESWNYPLREGKGTLYEGGLRIPAMVRWPGTIEARQTSDEIIISTDIYPTVAELAGISVDHEIEGISLLPHLISSEIIDRETLYWHYPHYHLGMPGGAIRDGDFKLIEFFETGQVELYNLQDDIHESTNLADELPGKAKELQMKLHRWREENQAKMPTPNPSYDPQSK